MKLIEENKIEWKTELMKHSSTPGDFMHETQVIEMGTVFRIVESLLLAQEERIRGEMKQLHDDYLMGKIKREDLTEEEQGIYNLGIDDFYSRLSALNNESL